MKIEAALRKHGNAELILCFLHKLYLTKQSIYL